MSKKGDGQQADASEPSRAEYELIFDKIIRKDNAGIPLGKKEKIIKETLTNPGSPVTEVAEVAGTGDRYVTVVRSQLRKMGWKEPQDHGQKDDKTVKVVGTKRAKKEAESAVKKALKNGVEPVVWNESRKKVMTQAINSISTDTLNRSAEMYEIGQEVYLGYAHVARNLNMTVLEFIRFGMEFFQVLSPEISNMEKELAMLRAYRDVTLPLLNAKKKAEEIMVKMATMSMLSEDRIPMEDLLEFEAMAKRVLDYAIEASLNRTAAPEMSEGDENDIHTSEREIRQDIAADLREVGDEQGGSTGQCDEDGRATGHGW